MATIIPSVLLNTLIGNTQFSLSADKFLTSLDVNGKAVVTVNNNGTAQDIPITISSSAMATLFNNVVSSTIISCTLATGQTLWLATARIVKIYGNDKKLLSSSLAAAGTGVTQIAGTLSGGTGTAATIKVDSTQVISASQNANGSGSLPDGNYDVVVTTGTGVPAVVNVALTGGAISDTNSITDVGDYTVNPTLTNCPVILAGLTGATLDLTMGLNTYHNTNEGDYSIPPTSPTSVIIAGASGVTLNTVFTPTTVQYWNAYKEVNQYYYVTDAAGTLSANTDTTIPVTLNPEGTVIYINNSFIVNAVIGSSPNGANLALTSSTLATAGTDVTAIAGTLAGGTFTEAATILVDTIQPVSLETNAAGSGYNVGMTLLTAGGTASTHATLTVTHTKVVSATVHAAGSGGTNGTQTVTGTTGTGTKFQASVTVAGGIITAVLSITVAGNYTANPTSITAEPVTGAGLTGAQLTVVMGVLTAGITTAGSYTVGNAAFTQNGASTPSGGTGATFNTVIYGVETYHVTDAGEYSVAPASPTTVTIAGARGVTLNTVFTNSVTEITYDDKESQTTPILYVSETPTYINALVVGLY